MTATVTAADIRAAKASAARAAANLSDGELAHAVTVVRRLVSENLAYDWAAEVLAAEVARRKPAVLGDRVEIIDGEGLSGEVVETFAEWVAVDLGGYEPRCFRQKQVRRVV
ncbi:hypothetical protein [Micromonospora sp. WMMD980]|uniref:hypothetical protein n=1 Tax=Micromonospora sp. WMMD980 TaxID=3016088 RepID=UPI0024162306|nr:hypothetical protein [Micromonospora sp. WMMD980]MDG4801758.1 hypothetical protein [Micromonospora sp. WMMD980]